MPREVQDSPKSKKHPNAAHLYIALSRTAPRNMQGNLHGNYHWSIVVAPSTPSVEGTTSSGISIYSIDEAHHSSYPWAPHSPKNEQSFSLNPQTTYFDSPPHALMTSPPVSRTSGNSAPAPHGIKHSYSYSQTTPYTHSHTTLSHSHSIGHGHTRHGLAPRHPSSRSIAHAHAHLRTPNPAPTLAHKSNTSLTSDPQFFGCIEISKSIRASPESLDVFLRMYEAADDSPARFPEHDRWGCNGWVLRALSDLNEAGIIDIGDDMDKVRQRVIALAMLLESRKCVKDKDTVQKSQVQDGKDWIHSIQEDQKDIPILPLDL